MECFFEGKCEELGRPDDNPMYCEVFSERYKGSYDSYSHMKNERIFAVKPSFVERWVYREGIPFIETFDFAQEKYRFIQYEKDK